MTSNSENGYTVTAVPGPIGTSLVDVLFEGPHWDGTRQSLYYIDLHAKIGTIFRYDYVEDKTYMATIDDTKLPFSFIIPVEGSENEFSVGIEGSVGIIRWDGIADKATIVRIVHDIEPGNRMNDGKADPGGRLICGIMPIKRASDIFINKQDGSLYCCTQNEPVVQIEDGIGIPNGLTWNVRTNKFYYIDTLAYDVKEYDYDPATGAISNRRSIINFRDKSNERPSFAADGMTIDAEGYVYVVLFAGSSVIKIDPNTGEIVKNIKLPVPHVTSAAFGGPNFDVLFITSASSSDMDPPDDAGRVFKVTGLGAKGLPMQNVKI